MKKILSALSLLLCLVTITGCNILRRGNDTSTPSAATDRNTTAATASDTVTTKPSVTEPPVTTETFPIPIVGEGDAVDYTPVEGQPQLKKIADFSSNGALSNVSCWDRFMLINFYYGDAAGFAELWSDETEEYEEWTELVLLDLLTGEVSGSCRMRGVLTAGFLENGYIYLYEYNPLTVKVYDRTGALTLHYTCDTGANVVIDPADEGLAWICPWEGTTVECLPLNGGKVQTYTIPDIESGYIQTAVGSNAYYSAYDEQGNSLLYRLASDGKCEELPSLGGYYGVGNALVRRANDDWRYADLVQGGDRIGYFSIEEEAYIFAADGDRFCLQWYDYENDSDESRLILCLPSSGRRTELVFADQYIGGQCWSEDALYLFIGEGETLSLCIWEYSTAPYDSLDTGIHTVSEAERKNRAYADALEEKWDISICFGEDVADRMPYDYKATLLDDHDLIAEKLRDLSDILDSYPEGFFRELPYGDYNHFEINLCAGLSPTDSDGINTAIAISNTRGSVLMSAFDVTAIDDFAQTFAHEVLHLMERRIDQVDSSLLGYWSSLTPGGSDAYYFSYHDENGNEMADGSHTWYGESEPDRMYFVDAYSKSFPTEDRARIFEYLVRYQGEPPFLDSPVLLAKAERLCAVIRIAFPSVEAADYVAWEVN